MTKQIDLTLVKNLKSKSGSFFLDGKEYIGTLNVIKLEGKHEVSEDVMRFNMTSSDMIHLIPSINTSERQNSSLRANKAVLESDLFLLNLDKDLIEMNNEVLILDLLETDYELKTGGKLYG